MYAVTTTAYHAGGEPHFARHPARHPMRFAQGHL